jgi:hypothetical protein
MTTLAAGIADKLTLRDIGCRAVKGPAGRAIAEHIREAADLVPGKAALAPRPGAVCSGVSHFSASPERCG